MNPIVEHILTYIVIYIFIAIMVAFTILSIYFYKNNKHINFTEYSPALLTSLGIFGTFLGITIGLFHFDVNNVDNSISDLLNGMKTAFITSLIGMALSIFIKIFQSFSSNKQDDIKIDDESEIVNILQSQKESIDKIATFLSNNTENSIIGILSSIKSDIANNTNNYLEQFKDLKESVAPQIDNIRNITENTFDKLANIYNVLESDLLETVKGHYEEFNKHVPTLWEKLDDFREILSESVTETMVEALKKVIEDFNSKINDQFGDNFKELNNAVFKLVEWQNNYKEQLAEMKAQYDASVESISKIEISMQTIETASREIPVSMHNLEDIIQANKIQLNDLKSYMQAFSDIKDKAVNALPDIGKYIEKTQQHLHDAMQELSVVYQNISSEAQTLTESCKQYISDTENMQNTFAIEFDSTINNIKDTFTDINEKMSNAVDNIFKEQDKNMHHVFEETTQVVREQLAIIDSSMEQEINRVMNIMGQSLGAITNQVVDDYKRLVNEMVYIIDTRRNV